MAIGIDWVRFCLQMPKGYVYILQSETTGRYYIGSALNVKNRLLLHNSGRVPSTRGRGPWKLVFNQAFNTKRESQSVEFKLKKKKSKVILEKIIAEKIIRFL